MIDRIPLAGVIGSPVSHSLSPRLHGHWLKTNKVAGHYVPMDIAQDDLAADRALTDNRAHENRILIDLFTSAQYGEERGPIILGRLLKPCLCLAVDSLCSQRHQLPT